MSINTPGGLEKTAKQIHCINASQYCQQFETMESMGYSKDMAYNPTHAPYLKNDADIRVQELLDAGRDVVIVACAQQVAIMFK